MVTRRKMATLALLATLALGSVGCSQPPAEQKKETAQIKPGIGVKVLPVTKGDITTSLSYSGEIKPRAQVSIVPKTVGRVEDLRVDVGSQVKEGAILAIVEHSSLDAQLQQAMANLESAKARFDQVANPSKSTVDTAMANLKKSEAALKLAQKNYDLVSYRGDIESMPQATALEQATLDYQIALAAYNLRVSPSDQDVAIAKAAVSQAEAAVSIAKNQLNEATIVAPVSGIITERFLSKGATASPSTPIVTIMSNDIEIVVSIEESRFAEIKTGQEAAIRVGAYPDEVFTGKVQLIAPSSDPKSRTFQAKVAPEPQNGKLKAGMYAEVSLRTQEHNSSLLVPKDAIISKGNKDYVYTLVEGKARSKLVQTGLADNNIVEVLAGLTNGEEVIVKGQTNLNDNDSVVAERIAQ